MEYTMEYTRLDLSHKALLEPFTKQTGRWLSDTNFTNMFMWRHSREISFCIFNNQLIIQTQYPTQTPFVFYPLGQGDKQGDKKPIITALIEHYASLGVALEFHSLQNDEVESLQRDFPNRFEFTQRRDRFEYIYNTQELIELSGRKFHKKKNHLNRFYLQYPNVCFESLGAENIEEVLRINNQWFKASMEAKQGDSKQGENDKGLYYENLGINDALANFETLGLSGGLLRNEGEIIAFSFGEMLDSKMALIHIEKANIAFSGAYQAINQALLKHKFANSLYANREEDLGIEGLRKAKLSYQPSFLLEKYDARLRD